MLKKQQQNEVLRLALKKHVRSEADETQIGDDAAARQGFEVLVFSQPQRAMMVPGVPDRRYRHAGKTLTFWFEWKAEDGQLTIEQHAFLLGELKGGELAACGTVEDFARVCLSLFKAGATHRESLLVCKYLVDKWAKMGYRTARPLGRRRRRPRATP